MSGVPGVWYAHLADAELGPYDAGRVHWLRQETRPDGRELWAGIWEVGPDDLAPGTTHESTHDETFLVLEGSLRLEVSGGQALELRQGSMVSLEKGMRASWTIHEPTREFFVYS